MQTQLRITSVYVTHDQREALALADQIVVMQKGKVLQVGEPIDLYNHPITNIVAEFLGYTNVFDVEVLQQDGQGSEVTFKTNGRRLRAGLPPRSNPAALCVCIRPDHVAIRHLEPGTNPPTGNAIVGDIILASFLGSHMQYRVRTGEHEIWEVLSAEVTSGIRLGSRVVMDIEPRHLQVLAKQ